MVINVKRIVQLIGMVFVLVFITACGTGASEERGSETEDAGKDSTDEQASASNGEQGVVEYPQLSPEVTDNEVLVVMNTTLGPIKMKLFPKLAPKAVENFLTHAEEGYYDGVIFHRVMEEFMIQGGDPTGTGMGGESIYGEPFEDEFTESLYHFRGALSMANAGPNTNGSQFFIVQNTKVDVGALNQEKELVYSDMIKEAYESLGGTPNLDHAHTVFGQVIDGMDTVDKIAKVETDQSMPVEEIAIESIEIIN